MNRMRSTILALAMAIALPAALPAWADHHEGMEGKPPHEAFFQHHHDQMMATFKQLKQDLKLNPEQTTAYDKLVKNFETQAEKSKKRHEEWMKQDNKSLTAVQRMEKHVAMLNEHASQESQNLTDFKSFYSSLNPEQQKKVDEACARIHERHHPAHGGHGGLGKRLKEKLAPASADPSTADPSTSKPAAPVSK